MAWLINRAHQRYDLNDTAFIITGDGAQKSLLLKNISVGGAGLFGDYLAGADEKVTFIIPPSFFLDKTLIRQARVAWSKKIGLNLYELGVDFGLDKIELNKF